MNKKNTQDKLQRAGLAIGPGMLEYTDRSGKRRTWQHARVITRASARRAAA